MQPLPESSALNISQRQDCYAEARVKREVLQGSRRTLNTFSRKQQANVSAGGAVLRVIGGKVSGIGRISEPVLAKACGGALLHAAVAQHDIARARNIPTGMHFGGPGDGLRAITDTSAASGYERQRPSSVRIDNRIGPAGICGVRGGAGNAVVWVLFRGTHHSAGDINDAAVPQVPISAQHRLRRGIVRAHSAEIGNVGIIERAISSRGRPRIAFLFRCILQAIIKVRIGGSVVRRAEDDFWRLAHFILHDGVGQISEPAGIDGIGEYALHSFEFLCLLRRVFVAIVILPDSIRGADLFHIINARYSGSFLLGPRSGEQHRDQDSQDHNDDHDFQQSHPLKPLV